MRSNKTSSPCYKNPQTLRFRKVCNWRINFRVCECEAFHFFKDFAFDVFFDRTHTKTIVLTEDWKSSWDYGEDKRKEDERKQSRVDLQLHSRLEMFFQRTRN